MVRACLFVLAGMLAWQLISFPPDADCFLPALVTLAFAVWMLRRSDVLFLLFGLGLFLLHAETVIDDRLDPRYAGDSLLVDVRIDDFPRQSTTTAVFPVTSKDERLPAAVRLSWFEPPAALRLGDVWRLELRLRRPRGAMNPGTPDYEAWLFRQRIGATGYVVNGPHTRLLASGELGVAERIRAGFVDRLERDFQGRRGLAVLAAVAVGARHRITSDAWERYALTGTTHLVAISGLHIGLAAAAAYALAQVAFGLGSPSQNAHRRALAASLTVAVGYAAVSGFAVPARRAVLMLALATAGLVSARPSPALRIVATAALAIMLTDPLATMAPGFRLSFSAVIVLAILARRSAAGLPGAMRPVAASRNLLLAQMLLLAGLAPLTALTFGRVSLVAPLINLAAVPLFTFVTVPFSLAGLALGGKAAVIGDIALTAALASLGWLESMIAAAAALPAAATHVAVAEGVALLFVLLPAAWILLPPGWPGRSAAWIGLVALIGWRPAGPPPGCADIRTLDVGQGLATIVRTHSHVLLYDTGPAYRTGTSAAERIVVPHLERQRITRIDRLILSHADLDHAGGAGALAAGFDIRDIVSGEPLRSADLPARRCRRGDRWTWDGIRFAVLHPPRGRRTEGNDASCVVSIESGEYRALLTGDIEAAAERLLLGAGLVSRYDVIFVPHHGSRTSSTPSFVRVLAPDVAIIAAGHDNQWGLPKGDVVARWREHGARVLTTAESGSIRVRLCADRGLVSVDRYRDAARRIWHEP